MTMLIAVEEERETEHAGSHSVPLWAARAVAIQNESDRRPWRSRPCLVSKDREREKDRSESISTAVALQWLLSVRDIRTELINWYRHRDPASSKGYVSTVEKACPRIVDVSRESSSVYKTFKCAKCLTLRWFSIDNWMNECNWWSTIGGSFPRWLVRRKIDNDMEMRENSNSLSTKLSEFF